MAGYQQVNTLNDLAAFGKVPLSLTGDALASIDRGQQADQSNLADLFSQNQHMQAMRPMQEQTQDLQNQTSLAQLPGLHAQSEISQRTNDMGRATFGLDVKNKLTEAAMKASDDELKQVAQHAQQLMYSTNPAEVKEGQKLWMASQHMQETKFKADTEKAIAKIRGDTVMATTGMRIGSNERIAGSRIAAATEHLKATLQSKKELDKASTEQLATRMDSFAREAEATGDLAEANKFHAEANKYWKATQQLAALRGSVGNEAKLDAAELINNGKFVTVNPSRTSTEPKDLNPQTGTGQLKSGNKFQIVKD
jgi:hypothetical protein